MGVPGTLGIVGVSGLVEVSISPDSGAFAVPVKTMTRVGMQSRRRMSCLGVGG